MMRFIIVLLQGISLLFLNLLFNGDVDIKVNAPVQINAGNEITIEVTLQKDKIKGFSRFQMELPNGLTAINVNSANADFSFNDQKVRLIWLKMPEDETITFSFAIRCNEQLKGSFDLTGKFSYIQDNERKSVEIQSQSVAIIPNPALDPNLLVDIKDFGKSVYQYPGSLTSGQVACIRQKSEGAGKNEYIVTLLVNKESLKKFAKIEEEIPAGYTAISINSKEGVFTFRDKKAKYLWMNLPPEPYFTVSYKLIPANGETNPIIKGVFSYIDEDKSLSVPIVEKDVDLANLTPEIVKTILMAQSIAVVNTTLVNANPVNTTPDNTNPVSNVNTQNQQQVTTTDNTQNTTVQTKEPKQVAQTTTDNADILEPSSGISFRVQIAAGHKPIDIKRYFRKYKLTSEISKEQHDGWIKYSLGAFAVYKDARDYRIHIWNTTPITDAFVSAYNDGKRITVQEALMVANQKWYK